MDEEKKFTRCFIAIEMPREAINEMAEIQKLIKKRNFFYGKFTEPENLHLTLKFLGEISDEKIAEVREKLEKINFASFDASLGGLGFFSKKSLRILWIKLLGKQIWELQKLIDDSLGKIFQREERFMGHITLARIKKVINKSGFLEYAKNLRHRKIKFKVSEFVLKKSELMPEGPTYSDIDKYKLY